MKDFKSFELENGSSQSHNLAVTALYVPGSMGSGSRSPGPEALASDLETAVSSEACAPQNSPKPQTPNLKPKTQNPKPRWIVNYDCATGIDGQLHVCRDVTLGALRAPRDPRGGAHDHLRSLMIARLALIIAASVYVMYSVGPSIRPICTR